MFGKRSLFTVFSSITGSLLLAILILPILSSVSSSSGGMIAALSDERITGALYLSFKSALFATGFSFVTGVPLAYVLSSCEFIGKEWVNALLDLPILIPHNAAGIALLFLFSPRSTLGAFFGSIGLGFVDTTAGIVLAMVFVSAPFMVKSAQDSFDSVGRDMEDAASNLGATPFRVFMDISLPIAGRGIASGCMLTWARAVSEFGAVVVLAYYPKTAPVLLSDVLIGEGLAAALPITGLLLVTGLIVLVGFRFLDRLWR